MKSLYFKTPKEWRNWLEANHDKESEIWLIFYKKHTGKPSLDYESAVEEALCFGWIDSIIKKIDESTYVRKFTPRRDDSVWSATNKRRVERLIRSKRMTPAGLEKIRAAKENGQWWNDSAAPNINFELPEDFRDALNQNQETKAFFEQLAPSHQKRFIGWINTAKRPETRERRIRESIQLLEKKMKLGLK